MACKTPKTLIDRCTVLSESGGLRIVVSRSPILNGCTSSGCGRVCTSNRVRILRNNVETNRRESLNVRTQAVLATDRADNAIELWSIRRTPASMLGDRGLNDGAGQVIANGLPPTARGLSPSANGLPKPAITCRALSLATEDFVAGTPPLRRTSTTWIAMISARGFGLGQGTYAGRDASSIVDRRENQG